jgi:hypothetical protein
MRTTVFCAITANTCIFFKYFTNPASNLGQYSTSGRMDGKMKGRPKAISFGGCWTGYFASASIHFVPEITVDLAPSREYQSNHLKTLPRMRG